MSVLQVPAVHASLPTSHGISIALHRGLRKTQGIVPHLTEGRSVYKLTFPPHHEVLTLLVQIVRAGGNCPLSNLCLTQKKIEGNECL